jgi:phage FluMu gp28-like protein
MLGEVNEISGRKKYTIHEVSLVRNIQYDVDNAIRRIEKEESLPMNEAAAERLPEYVEVKE